MSDSTGIDFARYSCPLPKSDHEHVLLGHGSGGTLTADLIQRLFLNGFGYGPEPALEDQATLTLSGLGGKRDRDDDRFLRGSAAVFPRRQYRQPLCSRHGQRPGRRWSDAALSFGRVHPGRRPSYGRPAANRRLHAKRACAEAGVSIVTGDTKVVDRGKGDYIFITTTGVGILPDGFCLSIRNARPGDKIVVSGTIGDHGIAIMSVREGIEFDTVLESDSASLNGLTHVMLAECPTIRWMRDPTRGGLSSSLNELAGGSRVGVKLREAAIPVRPEVQAACAMLGLDPLYVANEGKLVAVVPPHDADRLLGVMHGHPLGSNAAIIGEVVDDHRGMVILQSFIGGERLVTMLTGEQLPRIC